MSRSTPVINHAKVLRWYGRHGRHFPWRRKRPPYEILLSEFMLQQTQSARVKVLFPLFLKRFPTIHALASATPGEALRAWKGLGYNNRALRLHALAKRVVTVHKGRVPSSIDLLLLLPGIGPYTAHAVACFAFGKQTAVVDVNIHRVLSRWYKKELPAAEVWRIAGDLLPRNNAYNWNQALMDLGAIVCTASSPGCSLCPARSFCRSADAPKINPKKKEKREPSRRGIPNRLYRGKIVEYLRNHHGSTPAGVLAVKIVPQFTRAESAWFSSLLIGLEKDRLIMIKKTGVALLSCEVKLID